VGVDLSRGTATVGGTVAGAGNLISGNRLFGVQILGGLDHKVQGNMIGPDRRGVGRIGNGYGNAVPSGAIDVDNVRRATVGGEGTRSGNTVAFNAKAGIYVHNGAARVSILYNPAFLNGRDGIVLESRANPGQVPAHLDLVTTGSAGTFLKGNLDGRPNTRYHIQVFANPVCRRDVPHEGFKWVDGFILNTSSRGFTEFHQRIHGTIPVGRWVTTTATDPNGNTSMFSHCEPVRAAS
jgi:hypothetical protein